MAAQPPETPEVLPSHLEPEAEVWRLDRALDCSTSFQGRGEEGWRREAVSQAEATHLKICVIDVLKDQGGCP